MSEGDGIEDLGKDRKGRRWWRARLYWTDPLTSEQRETKRKIEAPSKGAALTKRDALLETLRAGGKKRERKRFEDVAKEYTDSIKVAATRLNNESHVRTLNAKCGAWWLDVFTPRLCQELLDGIDSGHGHVNNIRGTLIGVFKFAMSKRYVDSNPAKATERRREEASAGDEDEDPEEVTRALTPEQVAMYFDDLEANEPEVYPLVFTQYMLGCRFSEVSALRRDRLDLETGIVKIRQGQFRGFKGKSKGKRARKAALPLEARALLRAHLDRMAREQPPGWDELVFPRPVTGRPRPTNYWSWATAMRAIARSFERCGIEVKGKTHVARHTMITIAEDITPSEALLRKVVGHRSKKVHAGYQHPPEAKVIELGNAVGRELLRGRTGTQTGTRGAGKSRNHQKEGTR